MEVGALAQGEEYVCGGGRGVRGLIGSDIGCSDWQRWYSVMIIGSLLAVNIGVSRCKHADSHSFKLGQPWPIRPALSHILEPSGACG